MKDYSPRLVKHLQKFLKITDNQDLSLDTFVEYSSMTFGCNRYYYFILDYILHKIEYVHPSIQSILKCRYYDFDFNYLLARIHPEDIYEVLKAELEIMSHKQPLLDMPMNDSSDFLCSYIFRLMDETGKWITILNQCKPLKYLKSGKVKFLLCIHRDITFIIEAGEKNSIELGNSETNIQLKNWSSELTKSSSENKLILSKRELEIVNLLSQGHASKQISRLLSISVHTVETHRRNLIRRLGLKNTTEVVSSCIYKGLI